MNVMIDTNIILDDILSRQPHCKDASKLMQLVTSQQIFGYLTANSLTDIFYIVAKYLNQATARIAVKRILDSLQIISVDGQDCQKAIDLPMPDFEDALVMVCADKAALDYIVTNDSEFLADLNLLIPTISPANFIKMA